MGWYVPITGPDAGRLVRRVSDTLPSRPPPDEAALDACIPGRAMIREAWSDQEGRDKRDRVHHSIGATADTLRDETRKSGVDLGRDYYTDRVKQAMVSVQRKKQERSS